MIGTRALCCVCWGITLLAFACCAARDVAAQRIECGGTPRRLFRLPSGEMCAIISTRAGYVLQIWAPITSSQPLVKMVIDDPENVSFSALDGCMVGSKTFAYPVGKEGGGMPVTARVKMRVRDLVTGDVAADFNIQDDWMAYAVAADFRLGFLAWTESLSGGLKSHEAQQEFEGHMKREERRSSFRIRVVEVGSWREIYNIEAPLREPNHHPTLVAIAPDGKAAAYQNERGNCPCVGVVDLQSGKVLWEQPTLGMPVDIAYHPDGHLLYTSGDGGLVCRDASSGDIVWTGMTAWSKKEHPGPDRWMALDVSPDGKHVAVAAEFSQRVFVCDARTGKFRKSFHLSDSPVESCLIFDWESKGLWGAGTLDRELSYVPLSLSE